MELLLYEGTKLVWYVHIGQSECSFVHLVAKMCTVGNPCEAGIQALTKLMNESIVLSQQVLGNAKGVVATVVSILIFRNPVSTAGMIGYTITIFGVILYSESKKRTAKQQKKMQIMEKDNDISVGKQQASEHVLRSSSGQRL